MENIEKLKKFSIEDIENELTRREEKRRLASFETNKTELSDYSESNLINELYTKEKLVYGIDDRKDLYDIPDIAVQNDADSVVAILDNSMISDNGDGTSTIKVRNYGEAENLCEKEPFREQPIGCWCSGFLVGQDLIATAGHCIDENETGVPIENIRILFGFRMINKDEVNLTFENREIYKIKEILNSKLDPPLTFDPNSRQSDWAIVRLDKTVNDHNIVSINRESIKDKQKIHIIGHPKGLPLKYADGAEVTDNSPDAFFIANTDSYGGNSGSPIFNSITHKVEGILVRGERDLKRNENGCYQSVVCPRVENKPNCKGEGCTRTSEFIDHIPT